MNSNIDALKKSVANGKSVIASAITGKGVSTAADATFATMENNIKAIATVKGYTVTPVYNGTTVSNSGDLVAIVLSGIGIGENNTHRVTLACSNGTKAVLYDFNRRMSNPGYIYEAIARSYIYHNFTANAVTVSMSVGGSNGTAIAGYAIKRTT